MKPYRPTIDQLECRITPTAKWGQTVEVFQAAPTTIAAPSDFGALVYGSTIQLVWADHSDNETGFLILQSTNGGHSWKQFAITEANVTGYDFTNPRPNKEYMYVVFAFNDMDLSLHTNFATATMPRTKRDLM